MFWKFWHKMQMMYHHALIFSQFVVAANQMLPYCCLWVEGLFHHGPSDCNCSTIQSAKKDNHLLEEKKEEIWLSPMTKAPTPTEMSKGQTDNTNNATKSSIKQRLRTDLGRSVGITTATQLVWLTGLRAHLPTNHNSRTIKRTHV